MSLIRDQSANMHTQTQLVMRMLQELKAGKDQIKQEMGAGQDQIKKKRNDERDNRRAETGTTEN